MPHKHSCPGLYLVCLLVCLATCGVATAQVDLSEYITSRDKIGSDSSARPSLTYGTQWALIIGVNYEQGDAYVDPQRRKIPKLANARRDAAALKEKLILKYGYKADNVVLLLEDEATGERINRELQRLHSSVVTDQDSVLVFFAGHGAKQADVDGNVVIYPHDVELSDGRATSGMIFVRDGLITKLNKSKALHKLLILDSCYSGEIFSQKLETQAPSKSDNGKDKTLFSQPGFQVIASCRGYQEASDGNGVHSPFALALLRGLEEIPSNESEPPRIWTGRLMQTLEEEFRGMDFGQRPSYRSLAGGQGEFTFFPDFDNAEFGDQSHGQLLSVVMLRATSPGVKGNWWFDEMPWFMPSVRGRILMQNQVQSRSNDLSASIRPSSLRRVAGKVRDRLRADIERLQKRSPLTAASKGSSGNAVGKASSELRLLSLRSDHLTKLLKETDPAARLKTLESIEADLLDAANAPILEAPDIHLLAVVQHAIGREDAFTSYEKAIIQYDAPVQENDSSGRLNDALKALCHADFGDCLSGLGAEPNDSIEQYNLALNTFTQNPPPAFRVYCLCRLSSTYLRDNRWEDARSRLEKAKEVVGKFDSTSYLAAFVHRNDAWSKMIQWKVNEAVGAFRDSNQVLFPLIVENASPEDRKEEETAALGERSPAFRESSDFGAKVAYFHNLHGLAMAIRYRGDSQLAAQNYRSVIAMIEDALFQLRQVSDESSSRTETERSLLVRFINSQERLGDCNLLADPRNRDLAEAADDYRRALSRVHRLPTTSRTNLKAQLLYKQALAFSLPSPVQDCDLALEMCHHADQFLDASDKSSSGLLLALRTLTTPTVEMMASASDYRQPSLQNEKNSDSLKPSVTESMRMAIHALRDLTGPSAHRDQLELMMFASRNLIEYGNETSRLKQSEDVELLLSLNRLALNRSSDRGTDMISLGSQSFLRQYYDTAFLASLATTPSDAKRLLEIQHEATTGTRYGKAHTGLIAGRAIHSTPQPVLAVYQIDGDGYLICDCPRRQGMCISLTDICTSDELESACTNDAIPPMRLPTKIARQLDLFYAQPDHQLCSCTLQFRDPVTLLGFAVQTETLARVNTGGSQHSSGQVAFNRMTTVGRFPFQIPSHWLGPKPDKE